MFYRASTDSFVAEIDGEVQGILIGAAPFRMGGIRVLRYGALLPFLQIIRLHGSKGVCNEGIQALNPRSILYRINLLLYASRLTCRKINARCADGERVIAPGREKHG